MGAVRSPASSCSGWAGILSFQELVEMGACEIARSYPPRPRVLSKFRAGWPTLAAQRPRGGGQSYAPVNEAKVCGCV